MCVYIYTPSTASLQTKKQYFHIFFWQLIEEMQQKIVVKVQMFCPKCRTKALQVAADTDGAKYVGFEGEDKANLVVTGDGVDAVMLTSRLRKKVGRADIVSVAEIKP